MDAGCFRRIVGHRRFLVGSPAPAVFGRILVTLIHLIVSVQTGTRIADLSELSIPGVPEFRAGAATLLVESAASFLLVEGLQVVNFVL